MSTIKATFRWIDPFSGEMAVRHWPLASCDAPGVVRAMGEIDTMEAGLPPGEGAGYDFIALHEGHGKAWSAAFILRTHGLGPRPEDNLLVSGTVELPWDEVL